jgi:multiple sugar transport system substrate-binding protein
MQKKILSFFALLLLGIITFTSCSTGKQTANNGVITVSLSGWGDPVEQQLLQQVLNNFEAKHPNIKVKHDIISDQYMDVMKTRLIGETAADVFYLDALEAPALMIHGALEPLDSYVTAEFALADFEPRLLNAFKHNGKIFGFPKDFSTLALFYNKKAFQVAGLSQPSKTWEQLREYSKQLTIDKNNDGKIEQYGFGITPELARLDFMIKAFGGQLINSKGRAQFACPDSLKGLQIVIDMYRDDKSTAQPSDVGTTSGNEIFGQGKAAMVIEGPWLIPYLKKTFPTVEFATSEVPTVGGKKGTMAYIVAYVMNKQSKHKPEAWQLISYLTGKEGMKAWTSQGIALPTRKSVAAALGYDKNPLYAPFLAGAAYATIWQAGENLPTIVNNFNNQFISAMLGEQSLTAAMHKAQETANQEIELAK